MVAQPGWGGKIRREAMDEGEDGEGLVDRVDGTASVADEGGIL